MKSSPLPSGLTTEEVFGKFRRGRRGTSIPLPQFTHDLVLRIRNAS